jgi:hypothetical protein
MSAPTDLRPSGSRGRASRALRRPVVPVLLVAALLGAAVLWWGHSSSVAARQVSVGWASGSPSCTGTTVRDPQRRPAIEAVRGMRCTIRVAVRNASGREVRLGRVALPFAGPDTGFVVRAASVAGRVPGGDRDAFLDLDRRLPAGARTAVDVVLVFHPEGCNDSGTTWASGWPRVAVTTWHRTTWRSAPRNLRFRHEGRTPGCSH